MNRKEFIVNSCAACLSAAFLGGMLSSCSSTRYINGKLNKDGLLLDRDEFVVNRKGTQQYRSFIIVRNEALQYPICVYRFSDTDYSALWMRCSHQGAELQAAGDFLQCPAHGSEFNNKGKVKAGPADKDLRAFPVTLQGNELFIDLRKA